MREKDNKYAHLSEWEMLRIYEMFGEGKSFREIGSRLKRSVSTVFGIVKWRPKEPVPWYRMSNVQKAEYQYRSRKKQQRGPRIKKLVKDQELQSFVVNKLTEGAFSPEEVSYLAKQRLGRTVCAKTIYNFIREERQELKKYLLEGGKPRRQRIVHRRGRFKQAAPAMRSISERPKRVSKRTEFGHFEGDLLQVKGGYFVSLREIKTRKQFLFLLPKKEAKAVRYILIAFFAKLGKGVAKTITFDRGGEFTPSELLELENIFELLKIYYCDAYKPSQKGSVEQGHRWGRKFISRKSEFSSYTNARIEEICSILNQKPLKCLKRKSPAQAWDEEIKLAAKFLNL
jgi:IS30 family transposase